MCEEPGVKGKRGSGVDCDAIMSKLYSVWLSEKGAKGVLKQKGGFNSVLMRLFTSLKKNNALHLRRKALDDSSMDSELPASSPSSLQIMLRV